MLALAEERALVERAQDGDESAFVELVSHYRDRTWAVCLRITCRPADAEDALQDALTAAWLHLGSFRNDSRFGTWLHRIASNAALAILRKRRATVTDTIEQIADVVAPEAHGIIDNRQLLVTALLEMNEDFRVALVLREVGDFTYEEIAEHQGVPVQTVKSRLHRARGQLAQMLGDASN